MNDTVATLDGSPTHIHPLVTGDIDAIKNVIDVNPSF